MPVERLSVEDGVRRLYNLLPEVRHTKLSDLRCNRVEGNVLYLQTPEDEVFKMGWAEGASFRTRCGVDATMLGRLPAELSDQCWNHLVAHNDAEISLKVRDTSVVQVSPGDQEFPDYRRWTDRIINAIEFEGISNITTGREVGFGAITRAFQTPPRDVNDIINQGVYFTMNGQLKARPYNMRLTCTNGAIGMDYGRTRVLEEADWKETIAKVMEDAREFTEAFVHLSERPVRNVAGLMGRLASNRIIGPQMTTQALASIASLGEETTEYDLVNHITAQQHRFPNDLNWLIVGGRAIDHLHADHCSHCGAPV